MNEYKYIVYIAIIVWVTLGVIIKTEGKKDEDDDN